MEFNLQLTVQEGKVLTNAKDLIPVVEEALTKYNYVVSDNMYDQAKKDRAVLNKLVKKIADERKSTEEKVFGSWKQDKQAIMNIEKKIKEAADNLGAGINDVESKEKEAKRFEIVNIWKAVSQDKYNLNLVFEEKYLNKSTSMKSIEEDLKQKFERAESDYQIVETFYTGNPMDDEQIKDAYMNTLDISAAKAKADQLKIYHERLRQASEQKKEEKPIEHGVKQEVKQEPVQTEQTNIVQAKFIVSGPIETMKAFNKVLNDFMNEYEDFNVQVLRGE